MLEIMQVFEAVTSINLREKFLFKEAINFAVAR